MSCLVTRTCSPAPETWFAASPLVEKVCCAAVGVAGEVPVDIHCHLDGLVAEACLDDGQGDALRDQPPDVRVAQVMQRRRLIEARRFGRVGEGRDGWAQKRR